MNRRSVFVIRRSSAVHMYRTNASWSPDICHAALWGRHQDARAATIVRHRDSDLDGGEVVELVAFQLEQAQEVALVLPTHDPALTAVLADFLEANGLLAQANTLRRIAS
jgi:hypothetical protein